MDSLATTEMPLRVTCIRRMLHPEGSTHGAQMVSEMSSLSVAHHNLRR
ncbi:unnamed protein product, partial [Allacma fusca]